MKYLFIVLLLSNGLIAYGQRVFKTPSGSKYHLSTCRMVKNISQELSIAEAIQVRLTPCKICKPPVSESNLQLRPNTPRGKSVTVQCRGITKKGTKCKHMTNIANGYCFQHNPDN